MEINLKDKTALVYDYGNFIEVAQRISRDFGKVFYYVPNVINGFPEHTPIDIGRNVEGVERVREWSSVIWEVDIIIFPDAHEPYLQDFFRQMGKLVFGSCFAGDLEHNRKYAKELMKEYGLPVGIYYTMEGIDKLDDFLKSTKNLYVKSSLRGEMESWKHKNYELSKQEIKRMRHQLGVFEKQETYILEEPIDSIAEIGYDGFCIQGQYPETTISGIELKDTGYIGKFMNYSELPECLTLITEKFAPIFNDLGYRGAFSDEVMVTKDKRGFLIDLTCRMPQPNTSLALEVYTNYSQIIWQVASGIVPVIEYKYKYGVQLIIKSEMALKEPSAMRVPEKYKDKVKVKNLVIDENGTWYYTPNLVSMKEIGAVIGMGNTMQEAIKDATDVANNIEGFDISINTDCLDKGLEQIQRLNKAGIRFM